MLNSSILKQQKRNTPQKKAENNHHSYLKRTEILTLDSGINIGVRLLIFRFFSGATSLLKRVIHKKSLKFRYLMKLAMFIVLPKCSRGYVYSRGYAYSRVQSNQTDFLTSSIDTLGSHFLQHLIKDSIESVSSIRMSH